MKPRAWTKYCGWLAALTVVIWIGGFFGFIALLERMAPPDGIGHADAVVVLTGGANRINKGIDLLDAGYTEKLFITGVDERVSGETLIGMWKAPEKENTPCCLILEHQAKNTRQNAAEAKRWIAGQSIKSIILVTSEYHMPRAWLEFRYAMPELAIAVYPVESAESGRNFWRLAFAEYNKTLATGLYHRLKFGAHD